jgi:fatty acid-binding protein DegV
MINIIADTTCGIPRAEREKLGIPFVGMIILIMGVSYRDDYEIDT